MSATITLNGNIYTYDEIASGRVQVDSSFEKNTIEFCYQWLTGKETFTLTTSGSTGSPKHITFTRNQMIKSAMLTQAAIGLRSGDRTLVCLDTKYIAGQMMLVRSFVVGMQVIATEPSADPLSKLKTDQPIDFAAFVPYQVQTLLQTNHERLSQIRVAIIGGAPMDNKTIEQLQKLKTAVYATYGMTETISHIALMKLNGTNPDQNFKALPGVSLTKDDRGCLVIHTDFLTDEIVTNDLVELDQNKFRWLGRWDNIINTGGIKVIPEKVETQLDAIFKKLEINNRFFVTGLPHSTLGQKVCLIIEGSPLSTEIENELWYQIRVTLSRFEVPKEIKFVPSFVETETGKINRAKTIIYSPSGSKNWNRQG